MYSIERKDGRIIIYDLQRKPVYNAEETAWVITKQGDTPQALQIGKLSDNQLLSVLASAVRVPMDKD